MKFNPRSNNQPKIVIKSENKLLIFCAFIILIAAILITAPRIYGVYVANSNLNTTLTAPIDSSTGAIETIDYAHHEIHSGNHFFYTEHHDIPKNTFNEHLIITPNSTNWSHFLFSYSSTAGQVVIELSEDATYTNIGILDAVFNRNRNVVTNSTTLVYEDPTMALNGTIIYSAKLGANDKKLSIGGDARGSNEIILKQNTIYLLRVTELNVADTIINIEMDWYEHINK